MLKNGKPAKWPWARFTFPPQPIDVDITTGSELIVAVNEREWVFFKVATIDTERGTLAVTWDGAAADEGVYPPSLVHYKWFKEGAKLTALQVLADEMLAGRADRVGHAMLRRDLPVFAPGRGPDGGVFVGDVDAICGWATGLERSYVPIQGPPGTGKTFTGAHMIRTLVNAGMRVGVTAMSHAAIDNLMQAVVDRFEADGDSENLRAVRKAKDGSVAGVRYLDDNRNVAEGDFNVIAGTTWLFASQAMRDNPVDVLVVDEAGQLGLADTVAATISATNVILLGDPQQLPQVSQASHPGGAGASALEHLLAGELTVPPDRGVLLEETWRMHPDVCSFISEVMYGGKLRSHSTVRRAVGGRADGPALAASRAQGMLDRVTRGGGDRRGDGGGVARPTVDRSARRDPSADGRRLHGGRPVQRSAPLRRGGVAGEPGDAGRGGRHGRQVPGPGGRGGVVLDGDVVVGVHAPHRRLPVLQEPAQRGDQPGAVPGLPGVHRRAARHAGARRRGDGADLSAVFVRRAGRPAQASTSKPVNIPLL